jgi:hypothetical protein
MSANTTPIFTATPHCSSVLSTGAQTGLTGLTPSSTNMMLVFTAGANGSTIENIHVKAVGTTAAGMIRIFLYDGTNLFLIHEIPVTAITQSGTQAAFEADWTPPNTLWTIPSGYKIYMTTQNADAGYDFTVVGGDF